MVTCCVVTQCLKYSLPCLLDQVCRRTHLTTELCILLTSLLNRGLQVVFQFWCIEIDLQQCLFYVQPLKTAALGLFAVQMPNQLKD